MSKVADALRKLGAFDGELAGAAFLEWENLIAENETLKAAKNIIDAEIQELHEAYGQMDCLTDKEFLSSNPMAGILGHCWNSIMRIKKTLEISCR